VKCSLLGLPVRRRQGRLFKFNPRERCLSQGADARANHAAASSGLGGNIGPDLRIPPRTVGHQTGTRSWAWAARVGKATTLHETTVGRSVHRQERDGPSVTGQAPLTSAARPVVSTRHPGRESFSTAFREWAERKRIRPPSRKKKESWICFRATANVGLRNTAVASGQLGKLSLSSPVGGTNSGPL